MLATALPGAAGGTEGAEESLVRGLVVTIGYVVTASGISAFLGPPRPGRGVLVSGDTGRHVVGRILAAIILMLWR